MSACAPAHENPVSGWRDNFGLMVCAEIPESSPNVVVQLRNVVGGSYEVSALDKGRLLSSPGGSAFSVPKDCIVRLSAMQPVTNAKPQVFDFVHGDQAPAEVQDMAGEGMLAVVIEQGGGVRLYLSCDQSTPQTLLRYKDVFVQVPDAEQPPLKLMLGRLVPGLDAIAEFWCMEPMVGVEQRDLGCNAE